MPTNNKLITAEYLQSIVDICTNEGVELLPLIIELNDYFKLSLQSRRSRGFVSESVLSYWFNVEENLSDKELLMLKNIMEDKLINTLFTRCGSDLINKLKQRINNAD